MYNEQFINNFLPKLDKIVDKYVVDTNYPDRNELLSESQIYLLEFLDKRQQVYSDKELMYRAYASVDKRLKTFINKNKNRPDICVGFISYTPSVTYNNQIIDLLKTILTDREFTMVSEKYGFYGHEQTLLDISRRYNVTSERIRQIIDRAIRKLQDYCETNNITCMYELF